MKVLLLIISFFSTTLKSQDYLSREKQFSAVSKCFKGVHFEDHWMAVGASWNSIYLTNTNTGKDHKLNFNFPIRDFKIYKGLLYILGKEQIDIFNPEINFFQKPITLTDMNGSWPESIFVNQSRIFISSEKEGVKVFNLETREKEKTITVKGNVNNVYIYNDIGYIYADTAGTSGGYILNAVYLFEPSSHEVFHKVYINGAPGKGLYVDEKDVFLGEHFYWQIRRKKIHRKKYIGRYKSVYIPKPNFAKGRAFRDAKNLYFCDELRSKPNITLRSKIER